jgi:hypothetical protein
MSWTSPVMRCACGHVGRPLLQEGPSQHTLQAICMVCHTRIKVLPKLTSIRPGEGPRE